MYRDAQCKYLFISRNPKNARQADAWLHLPVSLCLALIFWGLLLEYKKYPGYCIMAWVPVWWGKVDSNHRRHCQQIYSLSPLATREFPHIQLYSGWSWWTDSNPRPADYKSAALPTELHQHRTGLTIIANRPQIVKYLFQQKYNIKTVETSRFFSVE